MLRRTFLAAGVLASCGAFGTLGLSLAASQATPFTTAAFAAAKKSGAPILVEVTAPWCPTCKAQKPILSKLLGEKKYANIQVLDVDFDSQKDVLRDLKVQMQSTLIVYKGDKEMGRSTGDTDPDSIDGLIAKTL